MSLTATTSRSRTRKTARPNHELTIRRLKANMSPPVLARLAGVCAQTIRNAERGHYVSPTVQGAISRALNVEDSFEIFGFDRQRESL